MQGWLHGHVTLHVDTGSKGPQACFKALRFHQLETYELLKEGCCISILHLMANYIAGADSGPCLANSNLPKKCLSNSQSLKI